MILNVCSVTEQHRSTVPNDCAKNHTNTKSQTATVIRHESRAEEADSYYKCLVVCLGTAAVLCNSGIISCFFVHM